MMVLVSWICRRSLAAARGQLVPAPATASAGLYSLGHGGNDAQKTIGLIWMLLIASGSAAAGDAMPPGWVIWSCYLAIGAGTLFGGWRIVKTMGQNRIEASRWALLRQRPAAR